VGLTVVILGVLHSFASAGVYSPDDPCPFSIQPDGTATPLPFRQFQILYADRMAGFVSVDPTNPGTFDWYPVDGVRFRAGAAGKLSQRVFTRWPKVKELKGADLVAHSSNLLYLNLPGLAIELLQPETRARSPNYLLIANLVHAHASRGDWDTALTLFSFARDCDPPRELPGSTPQQLQWQHDGDRKYYRNWLRLRKEEAIKKPPITTQEPDVVFEDADRKPIRFWENDAEAAKLPPDAIAVAQQLALGSPQDVKLLWLLAEIYLATGHVREAYDVFEMCGYARKFSGPTVFKEHRAKAQEWFAKLPKEEPIIPIAVEGDPQLQQEQKKEFFAAAADLVGETKLLLVGGMFAAVALVLLYFQVRVIVKRLNRSR
jgi:hypothetical protein